MPANSLKLFSLGGQRALVTGASKGLGKAMAYSLSGAGAEVAITSRHLGEAEEVASKIAEHTGHRVIAIEADASDRKQVESCVEKAISELGNLDILVNNAGVNLRGPVVELDDEAWETVLGINLSGPFYYCRAVGKHMLQREYGRVINIGSTLSAISIPHRAPYASSKGGILQLTRTLAVEWAESGVTVNAICPGPFATPINRVLLEDPEAARSMVAKVPMARWGDPEELATTVLYFASPASSFTTGAAMFVDGGYTSQ
ncbi:MAG: glucose 1-dehydrogenase [Candidatus Latescibacterota bacterium]|nr:glucose 1-dehydrogenase [Candidatus Latescibacterota bacterium]